MFINQRVVSTVHNEIGIILIKATRQEYESINMIVIIRTLIISPAIELCSFLHSFASCSKDTLDRFIATIYKVGYFMYYTYIKEEIEEKKTLVLSNKVISKIKQ